MKKEPKLDKQTVLDNPKTLFVYDDYEKRGRKKDPDNSLASEIKNLQNTVGIKTRKFPQRNEDSYWNDTRKNWGGRSVKVGEKTPVNEGLGVHRLGGTAHLALPIYSSFSLNLSTFQKRVLSINKDMANVMGKLVTGDYEKIIFSNDLWRLTDFNRSKTSLSKEVFKTKLIKVATYCRKFLEDRKLHNQEKLGLEVALTRDIIELLYGNGRKGIKKFKNNHPEFLEELKTYLDNYLDD